MGSLAFAIGMLNEQSRGWAKAWASQASELGASSQRIAVGFPGRLGSGAFIVLPFQRRHQTLQPQPVAQPPETTNHANGPVSQQGPMPEGLPPMDVAQVNLHEGKRRGQQGVPQGNGGVGVGAGIDQDAVGLLSGRRLNGIHEAPLMVALGTTETDAPLPGPGRQLSVNLCQGDAPIDTGLTGAQQIQIGSMENQDFHIPGDAGPTLIAPPPPDMLL